jgi:hypothetical protein
LFREFVNTIISNNKKFLIIGNKNAYTYQEIFTLIKNNQIWIGYEQPKDFRLEDGSISKKVNGLCRWFTNLPTIKRKEELVFTKTYNSTEYPKYDNYDAINVDRVIDIPYDYIEIMGVPVTFLDKYNPNQFEIIGLMASTTITDINFGYPYIDGKKKYARVLIKRRAI